MQPHLLVTRADLFAYVKEVHPEIERTLLSNLPIQTSENHSIFNDALRSAIFPGGKRFRPVLSMLGTEVVGGHAEQVLASAAAIEYLHTSSLIFDDLPCMDDATERRGRPALHVRYGEGIAVLVALSLLNTSYGLVLNSEYSDESQSRFAHSELIKAIGPAGLIGGQVVDLTVEGPARMDHRIDSDRTLKTSALISLAVRIGAILVGAPREQLIALSCYGELLGTAYQITDDLTDNQFRANSPTSENTTSLIARAKKSILEAFGPTRPALLLCEMAAYLVDQPYNSFGRTRPD